MVRRTRLQLGAVVAASLLMLAAGCGSAALTNTPTKAPPPTTSSTGGALGGAITKLHLISQDGCQTAPAEQVYPGCDRFMAELRSAVGTVQSGAAKLPNGTMVAQTSAALLADVNAFDRDGCGSHPGAAGPPPSASACVADLERVRAGLQALLGLTQPGSSG